MADVSIDLTTFQEALKYKYSPDRLKLMGYRDNPWFAICPKRTDFGGRSMLMPMYFAGGRGYGYTIADSKTNQGEAELAQFAITRTKAYSVAEVEREALKASVGDPHAWLEARTALMDERVYEMTRGLARAMYGSGSGSLGTIGSIQENDAIDETTDTTTDLIKLANPEDVVRFEVGMYVGSATGETGAVNDDLYLLVQDVDRANGWITVVGTTQGTTNWDPGDHLFEQSFAHDNTSYKELRGLAAWNPSSAPAAGESFFGVDRSRDSTRLAGCRYDGSSQSVHEAIIDAGTLMYREGGKPTICLVNPAQAAEVSKALQGQAEYDVVRSSDGVVGFDALKVRTGAGAVRLVSDPNCPVASAHMLDPSACTLWTLGETIELIDDDGQVLLRKATTDDFEVRFAMYGQFVVRRPKDLCHITLGT